VNRLLVVLASLALVLVAAPPSPAVVPHTSGTFLGQGDCDAGFSDVGWCQGRWDLDGTFLVDGVEVPTTAALTWSGRDDVDTYDGTLTGPRLNGPCTVTRGLNTGVPIGIVTGNVPVPLPYEDELDEVSNSPLLHQWPVSCSLSVDGSAPAEVSFVLFMQWEEIDGRTYDTGDFYGL
jgi:hypothetical protein